MVRWLAIRVRTLRSTIRTQRELALENLALRQQVAVWAVRARDPDPQPAPAGAFQRHGASDRGMDGTPTARGVRVGAGPRYLIRDRDQVYGERFSRQARTLDIREAVIAPRSPWQNAYAERVIGSIRRECLDHVVVVGERHLLGILSTSVDYYNGTR